MKFHIAKLAGLLTVLLSVSGCFGVVSQENLRLLPLQNSPDSVEKSLFTIKSSGIHVSISPSDSPKVFDDSTQAFVVTPDIGYILDPIVGGTCPQGGWDSNTYTTGPIHFSCTVYFKGVSIDPGLAHLNLSIGSLKPEFNPDTTQYTSVVENSVSQQDIILLI